MAEDIDYSTMKTEELAKLLAKTEAVAAIAKNQADLMKMELRGRLKVGEHTYPSQRIQVRVSTLRKFNPALAKANLSATLYKKICVATPNAKLASVLLTPEEYEKTRKEYDNTIKIELLD